MEKRQRRYDISKPQPISDFPSHPFRSPGPDPPTLPPPPLPPDHGIHSELAPTLSSPKYPVTDTAPWSSLIPRPLSDIRELSEPSIIEHVAARHTQQHQRNASRGSTVKRSLSVQRSLSSQTAVAASTAPPRRLLPQPPEGSSSYSSTPERASSFSVPQSSVPQRSSSFNRPAPAGHSRKTSGHTQLIPCQDDQHGHNFLVPNHGPSQSPVKQAGLKLDPITSDAARRIPSRTQIRLPHPTDILDFPHHKHPRVKLEILVSAPVFVGGGSIEGFIKVTIDENELVRGRRPLSIGGLSVDLLGIEQMNNSRKTTFLALGTELIDRKHPPPAKMVQPVVSHDIGDDFWQLVPSGVALPFMVSLPLDTGPPPFQSKHAAIRFMLAVTALVRETGRHYRVRTSQDVQVLPTYDPEKALTSLPSPLTASDELCYPKAGTSELLKVTAGLHRQVWVSGGSIFADVHIVNKCRKAVKKLELTLERDILFYKHAAAATLEKSASQARIFESNEQAVLTKSILKSGTAAWHGVEPHATETRTCELEVPRGHGTVRCGKWFEVRYFLNVTASMSNSKLVSVQLPIILIHMNSLDVVPNSVAQVAAAIEEKRARHVRDRSRARKQGGAGHDRQRSFSSPAATTNLHRKPSYAQGRAFAAPRLQSLNRQREQRADMEEIRDILNSSPRKHAPRPKKGAGMIKVASNTSLVKMTFRNKSPETVSNYAAMSYSMPPSQTAGESIDELDAWRGRPRGHGSLESMRDARHSQDQNLKPVVHRAASKARIAPYLLGLEGNARKVSIDAPSERSNTAMGLREKLDRSRSEFKAVRRKASGSLRERRMDWWEQRWKRDKDSDEAGWI